ncbi:MAG: hypothetical protein WCG45_02520, partial [bacterium]
DNDIEDRIGLIDFGMDSNLGNILPGSGISDEDICMQIHFEDFFKQQNSDVKNLFSSNSLEKLALEIVEKHPETKAVVGKSWLMDTAIAKRIGFKVYNRNFDIKENIGSFWGQFVDSNGQIKNNDVLKFLETGEPHYKIAAGAIMVEDFLGKYLPEERKGRISLKEQTEESREFIKDYNRITKAIEKWDEISFDELFVVLNSSISFSNYFKTPNGIEYINFFRKAKELNLKRKEVKYLDYKNKQKIRDDFTLFLKENENKFIEREVII